MVSGQEGTNIYMPGGCVCVCEWRRTLLFLQFLTGRSSNLLCVSVHIYIYNQIWTQTSGSEGGGAVPRLKDHKGNTVCVP